MEDNQSLEKQRERFIEVIEYLHNTGKTQEEIAQHVHRDKSFISNLRTGKKKKIPDDLLEVMQKEYNINPGYIRGTSNVMFNSLLDTMLENFEKVVDRWKTVYKNEHSYLHLYMDQKIYNFLVKYDEVKLKALSPTLLDVAVRELKEINEGEPDIGEYVILPRNVHFELATEVEKGRKALAEIYDPPAPKNIPGTWKLKLKKQQEK